MTRAERATLWLTALAVAVTRWPALSRTMWDWDEALFALAVRDYDVRFYHPHPPGFPLFIGLAKLIPLDDLHALQAIAFAASLFVFPAAYFLARALGTPHFTAMAAGLLLSFMPNVWFYGGTALSDVPSMGLSLLATTLLLRMEGGRPARPPLAGIALGIAAGFRPQSLLMAVFPLLRARRRAAIAAVLIAAAILIACYGAAAMASGGWAAYRETLAAHERYIRETDSFLSPIRPPLPRVVDDFFFWPYRAPAINIAITLLVLAALWRRTRSTLLALAIFGPFCLFAWLYLDFHSVSRFSIAYMPLYALLAADGLEVARKARALVLAGLLALMIVWTWPALRIVHRTASPPVAASEWIHAKLPPSTSIVYVDERLGPHADLLLHGYTRLPADPFPIATMHERARAVLWSEGPGAIVFRRDEARLGMIARNRYFETSVTPLPRVVFADGWYGEEGPVLTPWRWMAPRSRAILPAASGLSLRLGVPERAIVTVYADGRLLERIDAPAGTLERTWETGPVRELVLETSRVVRAPNDTRELGLRLDALLVTAGTRSSAGTTSSRASRP